MRRLILSLLVLWISHTLLVQAEEARHPGRVLTVQEQECERISVCVGNLKMLGIACALYAQDYQGDFPAELALLWPKYVRSISMFICPSRASGVSDSDVLKDFTVCYEYVGGLNRGDNPACLLLFDREGNHRIGHHDGDRIVAHVGGRVRIVKKSKWAVVWRDHKAALNRHDAVADVP